MANVFGCSSCRIQLCNWLFQFCDVSPTTRQKHYLFQEVGTPCMSAEFQFASSCWSDRVPDLHSHGDLNRIRSCLNLWDVQLRWDSQEMPTVHQGTPGSFPILTIVREFCLLRFLGTRDNLFLLCVTQFLKRLLVLQFCSFWSRNIAVHLLKKLLDALKQNFTAVTGILREILAGSSVASENSDLFAAMSFFNVPNSYVTCVTLAFSLKCVFSALNSCSSEMFAWSDDFNLLWRSSSSSISSLKPFWT